ncbi:hypothetical protein [Streptomyces acidiscabies]
MLVLTGAALVSYYGTWGVTAGDVVMLSAFLTSLRRTTTARPKPLLSRAR